MTRERSSSFYGYENEEPKKIDLLGLINTTESKVIAGIACVIAIGYDIAGFDGALLFGSTITLAGLLIRPEQYETMRESTLALADHMITSKPVAYFYNCLNPPAPPVVRREGNVTHTEFSVRVKNDM